MPYVKSVVSALHELHGQGIAHLDIRVENICFNESNHAVLIDLDCSQKASHSLVSRPDSGSLLYIYKDGWTYKQWDYVQLAIMIGRIVEPAINKSEYHTRIPTFKHKFLDKMFHEGQGEQGEHGIPCMQNRQSMPTIAE